MSDNKNKNYFIMMFIKHTPKRVLLKSAIEAGYDTAKHMAREELEKLMHSIVKH
jgi:hypothetical protein